MMRKACAMSLGLGAGEKLLLTVRRGGDATGEHLPGSSLAIASDTIILERDHSGEKCAIRCSHRMNADFKALNFFRDTPKGYFPPSPLNTYVRTFGAGYNPQHRAASTNS